MRSIPKRALMAGILLLATPATAPPAFADPATSFSGSTTRNLGSATFVLELQFPEPRHCRVDLDVAGGDSDTGGIVALALLESSAGSGWISLMTVPTAHVHVEGLADTRSIFTGEGWGAVGLSHEATFTGTLRLTAAGPSLQPWPPEVREWWPWPPAPGAAAIAYDIVCDGPATLNLEGGTGSVLMTGTSMNEGAGANVLLVATLTILDTARADFGAPRVRFVSDSFGPEAGRLVLRSPSGEQAWVITPNLFEWDLKSVDGGPGHYEVELSRAAGAFEAFWAVLAGLHPISDVNDLASLGG